MSTENFPSNSRRASQPPVNNSIPPQPTEEPKLEKVITGPVIKRKKPLGRRIRETLFSGDSGVFVYLTREVLIPAFQTLVTDMVTQGIERAVYGEVRTHRRPGGYRGNSVPRTHISYDRPSTIVRGGPAGPTVPTRRPLLPQTPANDVEEIILDTDFAAKMVAEKLYETIQDYGTATVANLKELLGETAAYTDHKWGWQEGAEFHVRRVREGYLLIIPDPIDLR
jgi:hypothetical protein